MASYQSEPLLKISLLGSRAMLFEAPGDFTLEQQQRVWALDDIARHWPAVAETVVGVTNLMIVWREPPEDVEWFATALRDAWATVEPSPLSGRILEIPVTYGGPAAIDLAALSAFTGLNANEVIELHSGGLYTVCALGSAPGFGYLHGLDSRLFCPRKKVPAMRVPAGAVAIGGMQTGVSAVTSPNGWNVIGHTSIAMFDLNRDPAALLERGDRIRFTVERIDR